jgi:ParB-like chromosome segregation protein Spo0J
MIHQPGSYPDQVCDIEHLPAVSVPITALISGFQLRQGGTDPRHVQLLAEAAQSVRLPSILVQKSGMRIIDGMHRCEVAKLRGEAKISARVIECTDAEALVFAIRANALHGLPLTRADRVASTERVLASHPEWSDRVIAELSGLSARTVAAIRDAAIRGGSAPASGKRMGRDGRWRPLLAAEGRERAARYMAAHPEAPLRQVAKAAGVSLGTAHSVRARLRRAGGQPSAPPAAQEAPAAPAAQAAPAAAAPAPLTWPSLAAKLENDPALRYAEGGRALLRWLTCHAMRESEWQNFVDAVPDHWRADISRFALVFSREWRQFARRLRDGTGEGGGHRDPRSIIKRSAVELRDQPVGSRWGPGLARRTAETDCEMEAPAWHRSS